MYLKNAKTEQNFQFKIDFRKKRAVARRTLKESWKNAWKNFVTSINNNTPITEVWKKIQCLNTNKRKKHNTIVLDNGGVPTAQPQETANILTKSFAENSSSSNYDQEFLVYKTEQEATGHLNIYDNSQPFNSELSMLELTRELSKLKNSSPGPDNVPNILIKNLSGKGLCYLLDLFNLIWMNQVFPNKWKKAIIVPILKSNKKPNDPKSYKPIALTCNIGKLLEKMVARRLRWFLETKNLLSPNQYGFRQFRSTQDYLVDFTTQVCDSLAVNHAQITVALDIEKAYEMGWRFGLLKSLDERDIKGNMLAFIINFLSNRKIQVRVDRTLSTLTPIENGFSPRCCTKCHPFLSNALQKWSGRNGYKFSRLKSEFIIFSRGNRMSNVTLRLGNEEIKQTKCIKLLGVYLDERLTWKDHIQKLRAECYNRLNILKAICSTH